MRTSNYLRKTKRRFSKPVVDTSAIFTSNDQVIGKDTLASLMETSVTSVERWIRDGMPVEQRGDQLSDWIFNLGNVKHWKQEH